MPEPLQLEVVTPERLLVREDVESVEAPGEAGYLGILPGHVRVLADVAERAEDINVDRAKAALKRAQEDLAKAGTSGEDPAVATTALDRANARMGAAERK